jgi:hypothetical protein
MRPGFRRGPADRAAATEALGRSQPPRQVPLHSRPYWCLSGRSAAPRTLRNDPPGLWFSQPRRPCCNRHAAPDRLLQAMGVMPRVARVGGLLVPPEFPLLILTGLGHQRRVPSTQPVAGSGSRGPAGTSPIAPDLPGGRVAPQRAEYQAAQVILIYDPAKILREDAVPRSPRARR